MDLNTILIIIAGACLVLYSMIHRRIEARKLEGMGYEARKRYLKERQERDVEAGRSLRWGQVNAALVCPHCHEKGHVRSTHIQRKGGVSGRKATAALLTGGASLIAVGLSRKESLTQAHCDHCGSTWEF